MSDASSQVQPERGPQVSARRFLEGFRAAAETLSDELIPIWRDSKTDAPYTEFMTTRVFPSTAVNLDLHFAAEYSYTDANTRQRRLDVAFFPANEVGCVQDAVVAIEIENKEYTISDEIEKLAALRTHLCVLFFYSSEIIRDRRVTEVQRLVRRWGASATSEFLVMWNKPYQSNPHWHPSLVTSTRSEELHKVTIL